MSVDSQATGEKPAFAWQPFTGRGVAAFAAAGFGRLWTVQILFALMVGSVVCWFVLRCWCPVIRQAVEALPQDGAIRNGQLEWSQPAPVRLGEGPFLAFSVDPDHSGEVRAPAHIYVELGRTNARIFSMFGYVDADYPRTRDFSLTKAQMGPWWGAWEPALLAMTLGLTAVSLLAGWTVLSLVYSVPVLALAFFTSRRANLVQCWKVAGASLMPGAVMMSLLVVLYVNGIFDVLQFLLASPLHLMVGWYYLWAGTLALPRTAEALAAAANPFVPSPAEAKPEEPVNPPAATAAPTHDGPLS